MRILLAFIGCFTLLFLPAPSLAVHGSIVISPGHGGYDPGIEAGGFKEKDVALAVAQEMESIFRSLRRPVSLTRRVDQFLPLSQRVALAGREDPSLFLSVHFSRGEDFVVYVTSYERSEAELSLAEFYAVSSLQRRHLQESQRLARLLENALRDEFGLAVRRREFPLPVLNSVGAPAVLIELPSEGLNYEEETLRVASTLVLGILIYDEED